MRLVASSSCFSHQPYAWHECASWLTCSVLLIWGFFHHGYVMPGVRAYSGHWMHSKKIWLFHLRVSVYTLLPSIKSIWSSSAPLHCQSQRMWILAPSYLTKSTKAREEAAAQWGKPRHHHVDSAVTESSDWISSHGQAPAYARLWPFNCNATPGKLYDLPWRLSSGKNTQPSRWGILSSPYLLSSPSLSL